MSWEQLIQAAQILGVPLLILVMFAWGVWRVVCWIGENIIIPARDHTLTSMGEFFKKLGETLEKVDANVTQMTQTLREQSELLRELRDGTNRQHDPYDSGESNL